MQHILIIDKDYINRALRKLNVVYKLFAVWWRKSKNYLIIWYFILQIRTWLLTDLISLIKQFTYWITLYSQYLINFEIKLYSIILELITYKCFFIFLSFFSFFSSKGYLVKLYNNVFFFKIHYRIKL